MPRHALPCIKCGKPLINVDEGSENQPYCGTEFVSTGHYGSTIWDQYIDSGGDEMKALVLVVNLCDTCILRAIDADVIQSRGFKNGVLLSHHPIDEESRAHVLRENERQYGSAWGDDKPYEFAYDEEEKA